MIRFVCDYQEGACQEIMDALMKTNYEQSEGYGEDCHCENARKLIRKVINSDSASVHFLIGGTSCNKVLISSALRPFEGAVCAETGHIFTHEAGTIEASGHKVIALPSIDGKLTSQQVDECLAAHWNDPVKEHMVRPGLVYITYPTEGGLLYSLDELKRIKQVCEKWGVFLYIDGARLGYGLSASNDVTIKDIATYSDAFYIGGTKCGALMGEAMVLMNPILDKDFKYMIKNQGGLLAKGHLLGIQFETLFSNGLYDTICRAAVEKALRIKDCLTRWGYNFLYASPTNQQFPIFPLSDYLFLSEKYVFEPWGSIENGFIPVRICTDWATKNDDVNLLIEDINYLNSQK